MANIHNLEPQAFGSITLKTTFGDLNIELFTKQCPKATRNFVQLCLDGYYNNTIFDRVEKDFIAIGGVSKSTGSTVIHETFPDEFHSRLRFTRRGLIATANTKKNENGPKFFFTLGPAPELQNKHTIFGRVIGNSVYSLIDLNECQVDDDCHPYSEQKIIEVIVTSNPFPELIPRLRESTVDEIDNEKEDQSDSDDPLSRPKPDPGKSKKLSFYPDEEDEEDEEQDINGKDGPLVKRLVKNAQNNLVKSNDSRQTENLKPDCCTQKENPIRGSGEGSKVKEDARGTEEESSNEVDPKEKRLREIRAQIQKIKEQIEGGIDTKVRIKRIKEADSPETNRAPGANADEPQATKSRIASKKIRNRERETMESVANFRKRLKEASSTKSSKGQSIKRYEMDELDALNIVDGDDWLKHEFVADDD